MVHRIRKLAEMTKEKQRVRYHKLKQENPFHHKCLYIKIKANRHNLAYDLTSEYLKAIWTGHCAISGIPIELYNHRNEENHAELDRIDPKFGYIKGNVAWTSRKFNRLKGNATIEELRLIADYLENISLGSLQKAYG